ncbi:prenyltransferase and squalene oxidase repeat-containing protein [Besnoitia besnoiti]|uniref:Protein farnesyltransferase subunit beta n=1 Tax=Besnoitia besnoiti TaxID=94643 RepID=A0A2A9MFL8_BESBE|nr:prenyltransferase and squalene oxidase repeat-containing protein [Besnoitia besnoiti]PFH34417.1 prenyltransferase and squalene oxidase repeat-containing protein [Besnoitia besnoiti]
MASSGACVTSSPQGGVDREESASVPLPVSCDPSSSAAAAAESPLYFEYAIPQSASLFTETQVDQQETELACLNCYRSFFHGFCADAASDCSSPRSASSPASPRLRIRPVETSDTSSDNGEANESPRPESPVSAQSGSECQGPDGSGPENRPLKLRMRDHVAFSKCHLDKPFTSGMMELDASRCWLVFWMTHALDLMGAFNAARYRDRILCFLEAAWDRQAGGGWGGGPGQQAHLAPTYAAVATIFVCGGAGEWCGRMKQVLQAERRERRGKGRADAASKDVPSHSAGGSRSEKERTDPQGETAEGERKSVEDADDADPRQRIYEWLMRVKSPLGGFRMHVGGEIDMRGTYCAVATASMLNMLTDELVEGVAEYVSGCQTYEGGIAGEPGLEAHGGYTYCGLAALCILGKAHEFLDLDRLLHWAVMRQMGFEGGFQGRTNKLVDACYSFWLSALFPLVAHAFEQAGRTVPEELWASSCHLQQYIVACCQDARGGLRDKPGKSADLYHTCYALSGLSVAQHALLQSTFYCSPASPSGEEGVDARRTDSHVKQVARTDVFYNVRIERILVARRELLTALPGFVERRTGCHGFEGPGVVAYYSSKSLHPQEAEHEL